MSTKSRQSRFDPDSVKPIVVKKSTEEVEEFHLFTLGEGDDAVDYFIPKKVPFNLTLRAMEVFAERGERAAEVFILRSVLGDDGYEALIDDEDLTLEDYKAIAEVVNKIVLGDREPGKRS